MVAVLLDTHAWVWSIDDEPRLTIPATHAILTADVVQVSPISFFEISQKVRLGKWPEMARHVGKLDELRNQQDIILAALTPAIAVHAGLLDWAHRDPFDRMLAATALATGMALISADAVFDSLPGLRRIW